MKMNTLTVQQGLEQAAKLPFALVRTLSSVTLGKIPEELDLEELLEARFFDAEQEIRLFWRDGELLAVSVEKEASDHVIEKDYLTGFHIGSGQLTVRTYLKFDEDGQAYVAQTCLAGWKEGKRWQNKTNPLM